MANFFTKFIHSVDFVGYQPQVMIDGKTRHQTIGGGIISLVIYLLVILGFIGLGQNLLYKTNPNVITSRYFDGDPEYHTSNAFYVGIEDPQNNYYYDPTIMTIKIFIRNFTMYNIDGSLQYLPDNQPINIDKCENVKNLPYYKELLANQNLDHLICVAESDLSKLNMQGTWGSPSNAIVEIDVSQCYNTTISSHCQPQSVIDDKLNGGFFVLNYMDTILDHNNYTTPASSVRIDTYTTMSNRFFKQIQYYFKIVDYTTDQGYLTNDPLENKYLALDYQNEILDFRDTKVFFTCLFRMSNFRDAYKRSYMKLQDVFAQLGGLIKALTTFISVAMYFWSETNFYLHLINSIFYFEEEENNIIKISKKSSNFYLNQRTLNILPKKKSSNLHEINIDEEKQQKFLKLYKLSQLNEKVGGKILRLSFFKRLTGGFFTPKSSDNLQMYKSISIKMNKRFDVKNLTLLYEQFDHLKNVVFSPAQKRVFNIIANLNDFKEHHTMTSNECRDLFIEYSRFNVNDTVERNLMNLVESKIDKIMIYQN